MKSKENFTKCWDWDGSNFMHQSCHADFKLLGSDLYIDNLYEKGIYFIDDELKRSFVMTPDHLKNDLDENHNSLSILCVKSTYNPSDNLDLYSNYVSSTRFPLIKGTCNSYLVPIKSRILLRVLY